MYRVRGHFCVRHPGGEVETFGQILRRHRESRGLSLRQLGSRTTFSFTFLSQVERGERQATEKLARSCDTALEAGGALIEAYTETQVGDHEMQRRSVLRVLGALAASPLPLVQWEALRHSMASSLDPDVAWWDQVVADYGIAYYQRPAEQIMDNLRADLTVLQALIPVTDESDRDRLLCTAARLSVIVALNMVAAGQSVAAGRWWRDAKRYADDSGDVDAMVLTRAWDVVNGCYDGRSPSRVVALGDEVLPLTEGRASAASCGLLAGHAQALSLAGRHIDAVKTVRKLAAVAEALPPTVADDVESLWGWPEHRLRHTEAWVYAHAGQLSEATRAQEQAVRLYPPAMSRLRTQVRLHHAAALIRGGHIPDGLRLAADVLDELPPAQHNELLRAVGRQVIDAVPDGERQRAAYRELSDRVSP
jgi:transcriptional regulator with XRE-family HTH domain